ncbi:putative homing nuclease [Klebsiella phage vB_KaeM_Nispero]|nr:putative homing nuclease [Klebsiella phage vB_KaeM_Nispero]
MYYLIYKITNNVNGKYYVGAHKTDDINDGYMGSGVLIKKAILKYGIENFTKEVIHYCESSEEMYLKESEIVTPEFLLGNVYNLKLGGEGGFDYVNSTYWTPSKMTARGILGGNSTSNKIRNDSKFKLNFSDKIKSGITPDARSRIADAVKANIAKNGNPFLGKTHSSETKRKISDKLKLAQSGSKNSQFGTMWINNGIEAKKISKDSPIPEGWYKGRKLINK